MQRGFGVIFLILVRLMANFYPQMFRPRFSRISAPPQKKNHTQISRPEIVGIPLQLHFLEPNILSRQFSVYWGEQEEYRCWAS